jgi:hypothetical protein
MRDLYAAGDGGGCAGVARVWRGGGDLGATSDLGATGDLGVAGRGSVIAPRRSAHQIRLIFPAYSFDSALQAKLRQKFLG